MIGPYIGDPYVKTSRRCDATYSYSTVIFLASPGCFGINSPILCETVCYQNQRVNKRNFLHIAGFNEVG